MTIKLSALRVSSEVDASGYKKGMDAIRDANRSGVDSVKAAGAALAQMDVYLDKAGTGAGKLSRQLITGYADGDKFEKKIREIGTALSSGLNPERAITLLDSLSRKFGLTADATGLLAKGYVDLAPLIERVNRSLKEQASAESAAEKAAALSSEVERLSHKFDKAYTSNVDFKKAVGDLNDAEFLGVEITDGYVREMEKLVVKYGQVGDAAIIAAEKNKAASDKFIQQTQAYTPANSMIIGMSESGRLASQISELRNRFDSVYVAAKRYRNELTFLNDAQRLGAIDAAIYETKLRDLNIAYHALYIADRKKAEAAAAEYLSDYQRAIDRNLGHNQGSALDNGAGFEQFDIEAEKLRRQFDSASVAAENFVKTQKDLKTALALGSIEIDTYWAQLNKLHLEYRATAIEARRTAEQAAVTYASEYQRAIDKNLGHNQGSAMENGAGYEGIVAEAERLRQRFDTASVAAENFAKTQKDLKRSLDWNIIVAAEYEKQLRDLEIAYNAVYIASRRQAEKSAAEYAQNYQNTINQRLGVNQAPATELGAGFEQFGIRAEELRRQFDPAYVALERFKDQVRDLREAMRLNVDITGGYGAALQKLKDDFNAAEIAAGRMSAAVVSTSATAETRAAGFARMGTGGSTGEYERVEANRIARERLGNMNPEFTQKTAKEAAETAKAEADMKQQAKLLRLEIDPLGASQARLNEATAQYNKLLSAGVITEKEFTMAVHNANVRHEETVRIEQRAGKELGLQQHQYANLGYQVNDIVSGFAMGQSPFMILTQQGGQVLQILQSGDGGILPTLKRMATFIGGQLLRPVVALTGSLIAMGAAGVYAAYRWYQSNENLAHSLDAIGRGTGATVDQLNAVAEAGARASRAVGMTISDTAARGIAAQFASTGRISPNTIGRLTGSTATYARIMGEDLTTAADELAKSFEDPIKGADELDKKLGFLTAAEKDYIKTLQAQQGVQAAQNELFDKYNQRIQESSDRTITFTKLLANARKNADEFFNAIGKAALAPFNVDTLEEQYKKIQEFITRYEMSGTHSAAGDAYSNKLQKEAAELWAKINKERNSAIDKGKLQKSMDLGGRVSGYVAQAVPELDQQKQYINNLAEIKRALGDKNSGVIGGAEAAAIAEDRYNHAVTTILTPLERARREHDLAVRSIMARTLAEREAIAAERERLAVSGQVIDSALEEKKANDAIIATRAQSEREAIDRQISANDAAKSSKMLPYQQQRQQIYDKYRDILEKGGNNAKDIESMNAELATLQRTNVEKPIDDANMALNAQISTLRVTADAFGKTIDVSTSMAEKQRLINEAQRQGIPITDKLKESYQALADRTGQLAKDQEELTYKMGKVNSAMSEIHDTSNDVFGGLAKALAHGTSLSDALKESLGRIADKMIESGVNEITNGLFGDPAKQGDRGGIGGPIFDYLKKSWGIGSGAVTTPLKDVVTNTASMTVTAATVTVNGTVVGGAGVPTLAGGAATGAGGTPGSYLPYSNGGGPGTSFNFGSAAAGTAGPSIAMSATQRDLMIRTLAGEAGGESEMGQIAVASVIRNRLQSGGYGNTLDEVIKAPKQFSTWNEGDPAGKLAMALDANGEQYKKLGDIADAVMSGKVGDPTGGAKNFYNPVSATADWTRDRQPSEGFMIGSHRFLGGATSLQPINLSSAAANDNLINGSQAQKFLQSRYVGWDKSGSPITGMNQDFANRLANFEQANPGVTQYSGYRSDELQAQLFQDAVRKYGSVEAARKWVAPPGQSQHNDINGMGAMAADLRYSSPEAMARAHDTAGQFGLEYPMPWEKWHIQPMKNWGGPQNQDVSTLSGNEGSNALIGASSSIDKLADSTKDLTANATKAAPALTDASKGFGDLSGSLSNIFGGIGAAIGGKKGPWGGLLGGALGKLLGGLGGFFGGGAPIMGTAGLFATGGIMGPHGPLPLHMYAGGGVANSPQMAIFGEGRQNEAYVPLPNGRSIPVQMRGGAQDKRRNSASASGKPVSIVMGGTIVNIAGDASEKTASLIDQKVGDANAVLLNKINRNLVTMVRSSQANYGN